jgi:PEP-CTERM motif
MRVSLRSFKSAAASIAVLFAATSADAAQIYDVDFTALNGSGVTGSATLTLSDDASSLNVLISAIGLEPGGAHVSHIHGLFTPSGMPTNSSVPTPAQDADGDGFIELAEGQTTYGPIIVDFGNVDPDMDGTVNFSQTFNLLDPSIYGGGFDINDLLGPGLNSLQLREIVLHGMTVAPGIGAGTPGEVNGTGGYLTVLPVAAGEITRNGAGAVPEPGTWAMMLIGFGAVGFSMRRRHAKSLRQVA